MARKPQTTTAAPAFALDLDDLITEWHKIKSELDHLVLKERELRTELFKRAFPKPTRGTNKIKISHGMALIGDYRLNYTVDRAILDDHLQNPEIAPIIHEVINFQPMVREGAFYKLGDNSRKLIADMITEKPGLPGLEIKAASKVRW